MSYIHVPYMDHSTASPWGESPYLDKLSFLLDKIELHNRTMQQRKEKKTKRKVIQVIWLHSPGYMNKTSLHTTILWQDSCCQFGCHSKMVHTCMCNLETDVKWNSTCLSKAQIDRQKSRQKYYHKRFSPFPSTDYKISIHDSWFYRNFKASRTANASIKKISLPARQTLTNGP